MPQTSPLNKIHQYIIASCITLLTFFLLYNFRHVDNNRLTSWKWTFAEVDLAVFVPLLVLGIILANILFKLSNVKQRPVLFLFLLSFAVSSIFWKIPEVIVDTSRYFTQAKHLEVYGIQYFISEWGNAIHAWTDLPLVPFLYGIVFKLFGESRAFIQVLTSMFFSFTIVVTYLIGKTLWDENTGFYAGLMMLGIPYIYSQVPLMLVDVPTMCFFTLSIFTFIKAMEKGGAWIAFASFAVFCSLLSKYSTWMMLSVLGVAFAVYLIQGRDERREIVVRTMLVALFTGALAGIVLIFKYDVIVSQIQFLNEYQRPGLRWWGESFVSTFFYQTSPFITIAALYSVYVAIKGRDMKFLIISWLLLLIVILQIKRSRYILIVFPMLTLMASYGLQRIKSAQLTRYIIPCIVGPSIVIAGYAYLPFLQKMGLSNFEAAGEYLRTMDTESVKVFTVHSDETVVNQAISVPIFDLYTDKKIKYDHDGFTLPLEEIETSPLRFTWEYRNPVYYAGGHDVPGKEPAIAVISNDPDKVLPGGIKKLIEGYHKVKVFKTSTEIFSYTPGIAIYLYP
jgi:hypothetical protein